MKKRILSTILAFLMMLGCFSSIFATVAYGADTATTTDEEEEDAPSYVEYSKAALTQQWGSPDAKVKNDENMTLMAANYNREIYCNPYTGEVYFRDVTTDRYLTTNPYDVTNYNPTEKVTKIGDTSLPSLMSQVLISYTDTTGAYFTMNSYSEAASRGQILVKSIKNGIRVEYTLGRLNALYLLPHWISCGSAPNGWIENALTYEYEYGVNPYTGEPEYNPDTDIDEDGNCLNDFYNYLIRPMVEYRNQFADDYEAFNAVDHKIRQLCEWLGVWVDCKDNTQYKQYECLKKKEFNIHVIDEKNLSAGRQLMLETTIKTYATKFNYDTLAVIHDKTGYVAKTEAAALFRISIEYTVNTDGSIQVRVPGNSIRYDSANFTLENISLLPYLGALNTGSIGGAYNDGYVFYPDGSGSLVTFDKFYTNSINLSAQVYGFDYSYYSITGNTQQTITMPVYGAIQNIEYFRNSTYPTITVSKRLLYATADADNPMTKEDLGGFSMPNDTDWNYGKEYTFDQFSQNRETYTMGYAVIVEEGESMMTFTTQSEGASHSYASAFTSFNPRPKDTYDLADTVSVSGNTEWTVASANKFSGNYKYRIYMLTDDATAEAKGITNYYPTSWVGIAEVYRDYLEGKGIIEALTEEDVENSLPLYIETFGSIETTTKFLSIPVTSDVALTTFDNVKKMYDELKDMGISNTNFKLTGYYNGGLDGYYPSKLKWLSATGGKSGFEDLLEYASKNDFGVFVEFNFSYASLGEGIRLKTKAARTVDSKYSSKKVYNPVYQEFASFFDVCVNANAIESFVDKMIDKYSEYKEYDDSLGISVSTLGSDLNSDFNEDQLSDRELSKNAIVRALAKLDEEYPDSVMTSTGNFYTLKYVDHIIGMSIDSNHKAAATYTVPFTGMVLHGYLNFTGDAINESGDPNYEILKSVENGASLYYMLSYENTTYLKEDDKYNKYYSIRYDIWKDQMIEHYNKLNIAIGDLQTAKIVNHQFISAERVLDDVDIVIRNETLENELIEALEKTIITSYQNARAEAEAEYIAGTSAAGKTIAIEVDTDKIYAQIYSILVANLSNEDIAYLGLKNGLTSSIRKRVDNIIDDYETDPATYDAATSIVVTVDRIYDVNGLGEMNEFVPNYNLTTSEATDGDNYVPTKYTISDGSIVLVTYNKSGENIRFIINYNLYDIVARVDGKQITVGAYDFVRLD